MGTQQIPPPQQQFQPIPAAWLNQLRALVISMIFGGNGITVQTHGSRVGIMGPRLPAISPLRVIACKVVGVGFDDYVTATIWDPFNDVNGAEIAVAKFWTLGRTFLDGDTISYPNGQDITYTYDAVNPERRRDADDGITNHDQDMNPMYWVGAPLLAINFPSGISDGGGGAISWIDMNLGGRSWARPA